MFASVDLCGKARRGFVLGLNEMIGYIVIVIFVEFYGFMECLGVWCVWMM